MSIVYHPQTDGQTEKINQILKQYLQYYINYRQNNQIELLLLAQFAYNSNTIIIGLSPFYVNYRYELIILKKSKIIKKLT